MRKTFESNSDAGQRGSIPALAGAFRAPRGLSLIEVLVAIFVVTVGLLGVVTLLPLSQKDASQGAIQDQVALVGKSAWRDFLVRGMNRPAVWVYDNGQSVYGPDQSDPSYEYIRWWTQDGPLPATHQGLPTPLLLDPWLVPRLSDVPTLQNRHFGFGNLTTNIPRVTLWDMNKRGVLPELAVTFSDDLVFQSPANAGGLPQQLFTAGDSKRISAGLFSWMAMLTPELVAPQFNPDPEFVRLSVIIFHRRPFSVDLSSTLQNEQVCDATFLGGGLGGVDVQLSPKQPNQDFQVKRNQWIALVSRNSQPVVRWYRVARAIEPAGGATIWECSLAGPDVNPNTQNDFSENNPADAVVVKGVVAVFEKVIPLDLTLDLTLDFN